MPRSRAVTRLAGDIHLAPGRLEGVARRVVVLPQVRGVAVRAHEVPVLLTPGPVQLVAVPDVFARVEMEPALPARALRPGVPGNRERLDAPSWQLNQILLQRIDTERVLDLEVGQLAVRSVGAHPVAAVPLKKSRDHVVVPELRIVEPCPHAAGICRLHRLTMLGPTPRLESVLMTARATLGADVGGVSRFWRTGCGVLRRPIRMPNA